jgi:hypothetical protein
MTKCVFYFATYPYCREACRGVILGPGHYRGPRLTFRENVLLVCLTDGQKKIIHSETVHDMRRADAQERDDIVGQAAVAVHALPREQRGRRRQRAGKRRIPRVPSLGDRPDDACAGRRDARGVAAHVHPSHPMVLACQARDTATDVALPCRRGRRRGRAVRVVPARRGRRRGRDARRIPMVRHRRPRGIHPAVPQAARPARSSPTGAPDAPRPPPTRGKTQESNGASCTCCATRARTSPAGHAPTRAKTCSGSPGNS